MFWRGIPAALVFALAAGCSDPQSTTGSAEGGPAPQQRASGLPRILETFEVGAEVYVRALAVEQRRDALWVGTSLGVHEVDLQTRELRNTFTRDDGLANEYVFAILTDAQGYKWFGTNGGGVSRYRDGEWKTYFPMHGLADYWVYGFGGGTDGTLWIGTWAGANRLDISGGRFTTYYDELVNEWVYGVDVDDRGRVWFGTEGGVSMYDGSEWREWTHEDGLGAPNDENLPISTNTGLGTRTRHDLSVLSDGRPTYNPNYVFCIHVDQSGHVWAGTWGGGASRYDGQRWTNLSRDDGLAGDIVFAVTDDRQGNLWFGTDQGLSRYDGESWQSFRRGDGLPGDAVYALATTAEGDVWAGTRGGVARIGY